MNREYARFFEARRASLALITAEHAAYDKALAKLIGHVSLVRAHRVKPDPGLFSRGLGYLATFMDRFHHPKEDEILFKAVRERTREADEVLAELQFDHSRGPAEFFDLQLALAKTRDGSSGQFEDFAQLIERFAHDQLAHMKLEEGTLMPIAERVLKGPDWLGVQAAFEVHRDPLFGAGVAGRKEVLPDGSDRS